MSASERHPTDSSDGADAQALLQWLALASDAARTAGDLLRAAAGIGRFQLNDDSGRDLKLQLDRDAEAAILARLAAGSPFGIISEEAGATSGADRSRRRWIVDPLDGTMNFFRGIPLSCVSVALWDGDAPVLGAIYDFERGDLFTGLAGGGSWCNGVEMAVSRTPTVGRAILCTGFPVASEFSEQAVQRVVGEVLRFRRVRWLGSAALSLAYVAAGRADAYMERCVRLWDVAAGIAIVKGAGGYAHWTAVDATTGTVHAHNGLLTELETT